ncbi:MAG: hypothetical protein Q4G49_01290 [Paracoccus sp. (in: a-proteobacteria)]|nr:hypothetical protein [Paracoccus sp. (in: a-proteobacteria)]
MIESAQFALRWPAPLREYFRLRAALGRQSLNTNLVESLTAVMRSEPLEIVLTHRPGYYLLGDRVDPASCGAFETRDEGLRGYAGVAQGLPPGAIYLTDETAPEAAS